LLWIEGQPRQWCDPVSSKQSQINKKLPQVHRLPVAYLRLLENNFNYPSKPKSYYSPSSQRVTFSLVFPYFGFLKHDRTSPLSNVLAPSHCAPLEPFSGSKEWMVGSGNIFLAFSQLLLFTLAVSLVQRPPCAGGHSRKRKQVSLLSFPLHPTFTARFGICWLFSSNWDRNSFYILLPKQHLILLSQRTLGYYYPQMGDAPGARKG